jgi:hypothetical protein
MMDLTFDITWLGGLLLLAGALVFAGAVALIGESPGPIAWVVTTIAAFAGAFGASEYFGQETFAPVWEGVALWPALVGGIIVGGAAEAVVRFIHGRPVHGARPI